MSARLQECEKVEREEVAQYRKLVDSVQKYLIKTSHFSLSSAPLPSPLSLLLPSPPLPSPPLPSPPLPSPLPHPPPALPSLSPFSYLLLPSPLLSLPHLPSLSSVVLFILLIYVKISPKHLLMHADSSLSWYLISFVILYYIILLSLFYCINKTPSL